MFVAMASLAVSIAVPEPADTLEYTVLNHGSRRGEMRVILQADSVVVRYHRNPGPRQQVMYVLAENGSPRSVEVRGLLPDLRPTAVRERFELIDAIARWRSPSDSGMQRADRPGFYQVTTDTPYGASLLAHFLLGQPNHSASLFPAGTMQARIASDTSLEIGAAKRRVRLVMIEGVTIEPIGVWLDDRSRLLASDAGWFITVRRGAESALPQLRAIERAYRRRSAELLALRLAPPKSTAVVIRNGDVFDSERGVILPRHTVVIVGERIVAVGPAASVPTPPGARVIDATGKTVLPGLWDMHTHARGGLNTVLTLAAGITTTRSMGADMDVEITQRDLAAAGVIISPRLLLAGFIDGPGDRHQVPTAAIVTTEEEARAWVARYDSLGYRQIKVYDSVHPFLILSIAAEAKTRGMRLSGHLPRGISLPAAVHMGFDEIQHAFNLISTFYPDSLFTPQLVAPAAVARAVAPGFDVDAPRVTELLSLLRRKGTVVDGTFNVEQDPSEVLPDSWDPVYGSSLEWVPQAVRRAGALNIAPLTSDLARAKRAANPTYLRLLKRLFDARVMLVPGTDNFPLAYHGELEIYERAGIPAHRVLQIATIVPARVMGDDKEYGSIRPGKIADLAIVDGEPAARIRDLRRTEIVIRAGRVYNTRELYVAAGLMPRF